MINFIRENRFYFFVVAYTALFTALAFFGAEEATRVRAEREASMKVAEARLNAFTKNKAFYRLPRMDLSMSAAKGEAHHIRLGISLEMKKENLDKFDTVQPRVTDRIVTFLGHQDIDKFQGPDGINTLRQDILFEVNKASGSVVIFDVIFRELIIR